MMVFTIRCMTETDIDTVFAIEQDVHIAPWSKDILRDCVRVGYDCRVLEIDVEAKLLIGGYIISRYNNNCYHILNFCIAKPFQSKGYGRKLLQSTLYSLNQSRQLDYAALEVRPSNQVAMHLYQSIGFEQVEIKPAYYVEENYVEDAIVLQKKLPL